MNLNLRTLNVTDDTGASLGHIIDVVRNSPAVAAELKGLLDSAWIDREAEHAAALRDELARSNRAEEAADTLRDQVSSIAQEKMADAAEIDRLRALLAKADPVPADLPATPDEEDHG